jgi:hypothetical protein
MNNQTFTSLLPLAEGDGVGRLVRDRSVPGMLGALEAGLGLVVMAFFSIMVVGVGGLFTVLNSWLYGYPPLGRAALVSVSLLWVVVAFSEWRSFQFFVDGLTRPPRGAPAPAPVRVALGLKVRGVLARAAVALWWLAHAAASVGLAELLTSEWKFYNPSAAEKGFEVVAPLAVLFGTAFAMNTHLLVALYALTGSERLVRRVYKFRALIDLAVVLLLPAVMRGITENG